MQDGPLAMTAGADPAGEAPRAATVDRSGWRRALFSALTAWVAVHLAYLVINLLVFRARGAQPPAVRTILAAWQRWDTGHYLRIAEHGYGYNEVDFAFFPLYPMLIRIADLLLPGGPLLAALAVSNLACLGALVMIHRLTALELDEGTARRTVYYLVAFPTAFFLSAAYNHSLFLLLATAALYAMRRGHWWLAGGLGALSSATRSVGVLLLIPFVYEYLRQRGFSPRGNWPWRRIRPDALAVVLVPAGLLAYAGYCWWAFDDALAFSHAQRHWYRYYTWPGESLYRTAREALAHPLLAEFSVVNWIDLLAGVGFLVLITLCLVGPWRLRPDQLYLSLFALAVVLLPMFVPAADNRPLISMSRHVLDALPAFMILGRFGARSWFDRGYPLPAMALQTLLLVIFMGNGWVA